MSKKKQFNQKFIKDACALEEQIESLNVKAAWDVLRQQRKLNTRMFCFWLFQKMLWLPPDVAVYVPMNNDWTESFGLSAKYSSYDSYVSVSEDNSTISLTVDSKRVELVGWSFMDVFRDACDKFKEHIRKQYEAEYTALIQKNKTLRIPFPNIQVQVEEPNYEIYPKAKPHLILFRNPEDASMIVIPITKSIAEKIVAMGSIVTQGE